MPVFVLALLLAIFGPQVSTQSNQIGDPCDPNDPSTYEPYRCEPSETSLSGYAIAQ